MRELMWLDLGYGVTVWWWLWIYFYLKIKVNVWGWSRWWLSSGWALGVAGFLMMLMTTAELSLVLLVHGVTWFLRLPR